MPKIYSKYSNYFVILVVYSIMAFAAEGSNCGFLKFGERFLRGSVAASRLPSKWNGNNPPFIYHPQYSCPWPEKHRFPMWKFRNLYDVMFQQQLIRPEEYFMPVENPPDEWFTIVHEPQYYHNFTSNNLSGEDWRRIGFEYSEALVRRTRLEVAGTVLTAQLALKHGLACNLAGGTHHAHRDYGSGYTILNDLAITSRLLQRSNIGIDRILIVDLDVHQGDGTAAIFEDDPSVFTMSMHCQENFPLRKMKSDLDVGLEAGCGDNEYMQILAQNLQSVLDSFPADLVLFDAGVDPYMNDRLGKLKLTEQGLFDRDLYTIKSCIERGIPIACVIGGGYDENPTALARRHSIVHRAAIKVWEDLSMKHMEWM